MKQLGVNDFLGFDFTRSSFFTKTGIIIPLNEVIWGIKVSNCNLKSNENIIKQ